MARQKATSQDTKTLPKKKSSASQKPPEVRRAVEMIGVFTRVAKRVGVTPSHAIQVAKSMRQSQRVVEAIVQEVRRIERATERAA